MLIGPFQELDEALAALDGFSGVPEEFELCISGSLLDPVGIAMALITDRVLEKDWEPNGFEQRLGYRFFRYKTSS